MITLKPITFGLVLMAISASLMSSAWAGGDSSDGHTHAAPEPVVPMPLNAAAPRVNSQTDLFELVGVLDGKVLTMYLDQFGTNAPVAQAQIEVASGSWKATATEIAPAIYTVSADAWTKAGRYPLTLTVLAGDDTDLMDATLEVNATTAATAAVQQPSYTGQWVIWSGAGVLSLAALALLSVRRRKQHRKHGQHQPLN